MADRQPVPDPTDAEWERFWLYVRNAHKEGCWEWIGGCFSSGYGTFALRGLARRAHRVLYVWLNGEIADDHALDHLCGNRRCVNPAHLAPQLPRENVLRGEGPTAVNARKTKPDCGHAEEFTYVDPRGWRGCRKCRSEATARYNAKNRERINAKRRARRRSS